MTNTERRFETAFKEVDKDDPGLIQEDDGTVWLVNPDGSRTELPGGGGGSGDWGQASTSHFSGSGSPVGVVTPSGDGDLYVDVAGPGLWQANGVTNTDWEQIGSGGASGASRWVGPTKINCFAGQQFYEDFNFTPNTVDGGTFTITHSGDETTALDWDASALEVQAALEALPSIGADGVVSVSAAGTINEGYNVSFGGLVAQELLTFDPALLTGPDAPYTITSFGYDAVIPLIELAEGDLLEDIMWVPHTRFEAGAELKVGDDPADFGGPPAWAPNENFAPFDLNTEQEPLTNFEGASLNATADTTPTTFQQQIASWIDNGSPNYNYVPVMASNPATIYANTTGIAAAPTEGEVWIWVKVTTPAAAEEEAVTSGPVTELHYLNGLVKDFSPTASIDTISALLFDPTPQEWQASHEHTNTGTGASQNFVGGWATKVGDDSVSFIAYANGSAVTGDVEPTWSEDGSTPVDDGTVARPLVWNPLGVYEEWAATTAIDTGHVVIGAGTAWVSDGGGNTGGSEPSWPATPNSGDSVSDGDITWANYGPAAVWTADTRYSFRVDAPAPASTYSQFNSVPAAAVPGTSYVFTGMPSGLWGTTGVSEPDWGDAMSGDGSYWIDNDIVWQESTAQPALVLTGIVAPSAETVITVANGAPVPSDLQVTLEDQAECESDYGSQAVSTEGNRFNQDDQNIILSKTKGRSVMYADGVWTGLNFS